MVNQLTQHVWVLFCGFLWPSFIIVNYMLKRHIKLLLHYLAPHQAFHWFRIKSFTFCETEKVYDIHTLSRNLSMCFLNSSHKHSYVSSCSHLTAESCYTQENINHVIKNLLVTSLGFANPCKSDRLWDH